MKILNILRSFHTRKTAATAVLTVSVVSLSGCKGSIDKHPTVQPPVKVEIAVMGDLSRSGSRVYSGTVCSNSSSMLSFSVPGTVESVNISEGQKVSSGQVIASLRTEDFRYADNIARAQLAEAEDAYARLKKLHDANALPDIKWVEIQQKLEQARNAAEISGRALRETTLRAPFAGVISRKMVERGQNVAPIEPVVELMAPDDLAVEISVGENELSNMKVGDIANITFESPSIPSIEGKIVSKAVSADPLTRTFKIKISLPKNSANIHPGMLASVTFPANETSTESTYVGFSLPSQAVLLADDNRTFVWVVTDGKTQRRYVEADELSDAGVFVSRGLAEGDSVVVAGMQKVGSGSVVEVQSR